MAELTTLLIATEQRRSLEANKEDLVEGSEPPPPPKPPQQAVKLAAKRNDRCPCGSGKKFKRCCIPS